MEMGNFIHDASGFLTVQEAIGRVPSLSVSAADERNLYFSDLLEFIGNIERSQFLLVVSGCRAAAQCVLPEMKRTIPFLILIKETVEDL